MANPIHMPGGLASAKPTLVAREFYYATDTGILYLGNPGGTEFEIHLDADYVRDDLFTANTILKCDAVTGTPEALTIDAQRIVGRITGGEITGLTAAQVNTLLDTILNTVIHANEILYATTDHTPAGLAVAASRIVGRKSTGDIAAMSAAETKVVLGTVGDVFSFSVTISGLLYVADAIVYVDVPFAGTLTRIYAKVGTCETGDTIDIDVRESGAATILSADISIAQDAYTADTTSFADNTFSQFARFLIDINGCTIGRDLQLTFFFTKS